MAQPASGQAGGDGQGEGTELPGSVEAVLAAFDQSAYIVFAVEGPDHRIAAYNQVSVNLFGPRALGMPVREAFAEVESQRLFDLYDDVYRTGEPKHMHQWRLQLQRPEGNPVELYVDFALTPWRDADGEIVGVVGAANDITALVEARRAAERKQAASEGRYLQAQGLVTALQDALLPQALPVLPGAAIAARYLVAAHDQAAGGDWFDAIPLDGGRVALVVGDVVGHGVTASAAMGQLRAVLGAALAESGDLDVPLAWADRLATASPVMRAATVCVAILDPATGAVRYATCGHPPPLILTPGGAARFLERSGAGPLGTGAAMTSASETVRPGEVLLLYSDGLIERAGRPLSERLQMLARVAGAAVANRALPLGAPAAATERVCRQSVEIMTRDDYADDVTVLAAQRRADPVEPLRRELSSSQPAKQLTDLRTSWHEWLDHFDPTRHDQHVTELAVTELVANAIEHAYPNRTGPVRLSAELGADGVLQVEVADQGTWREPTGPEATSGRGLWMTGAVVDELRLNHDGRAPGTVATIRHRLRRPASLGPDAARSPHTPTRSSAMEFSARLEEGPPRTLRVAGPLDITTAASLADRLDTTSRGGVHALVVDLTDVDVLASAGVSVLFNARDQHATHGSQLTIRAAPDSVPAQILDLVGLDYTADSATR